MKVRDLIAYLQKCKQSDEISIASDAEGNRYHELGLLQPETSQSGKNVLTIYPDHKETK
jgi:hypothetical protein